MQDSQVAGDGSPVKYFVLKETTEEPPSSEVHSEDGQEPASSDEWLQSTYNTEQGTRKLFEDLQGRVDSDTFLGHIVAARSGTVIDAPVDKSAHVNSDVEPLENVEQKVTDESLKAPDWELVNEIELTLFQKPEAVQCPENNSLDSDFVLVDKDQVMDALVMHIAGLVATHPEAFNLSPAQLQRMLSKSLKELQKGRIRTLYEWGKLVYRGASWTYGLCTMWTNPWLIKMVLSFLLNTGRLCMATGSALCLTAVL